MPRRKYHTGSRWALWRWTETPSGYIDRLHLIQTPIGAIMLHWINAPDAEPWLHDHPVSFIAIPLRGWYVERRIDIFGDSFYSKRSIRRWNFIRAVPEDRHSIRMVARRGCLTLVFAGPKRQDWGFFTPEGKIGWREYNRGKYGNG